MNLILPWVQSRKTILEHSTLEDVIMYRKALIVVLAFAVIQTYESVQVQMPEAGAFTDDTDSQGDLESQVAELRRNVTELWSYVHELKTSVSGHLTHLRLHQVQLENSVHELQHHSHGEAGVSEAHTSHTDDHHHSGEHHSHSGEQHSHTDDHHSHTDDHHSHGGSDHHSGEQNSHTDDHHSHGSSDHHHSGEQHSHSGEQHGHDDAHSSHSHSHSHTTNEYRDHHHSGEQGGDHHHQTGGDDHHHDHKDSHETGDMSQQTQQAVDPVLEPIALPTTRQEHYHHHHHSQPHNDIATKDPFQLVNMHPETHSHHSHSRPTSRSRNSTIDLPKYSEYLLYNFAACNMQPNRAIREDLQQDVQGTISLWQKKTGGPLNIHVRVQGFAVGDHHAHQQQQEQDMDNETPVVGHNHGFHVHSIGDLSDGCQSTGPHFNPKGATHAGPHDLNRHIGDFGNINCDDHGKTNVIFSDDVASLRGPYSIIGKSMVIHENKDDLGLGGDAESLKTGNAGTRIACCIIEKMDKLPIRTYRIVKTATQHQNHN